MKQENQPADNLLTDEEIALLLDVAGEETTYKGVGIHVTTLDIRPTLKAQLAKLQPILDANKREIEQAVIAEGAKLSSAYEEYIKLLIAELDDVIPIAQVHGWKSHRFEDGEKAREKIAKLRAGEKI